MAAVAPSAAARLRVLAEPALATGLTLGLALQLERPSAWLALPVLLLFLPGRHAEDYGIEPRLRPPPWRTHVAIAGIALAGYAALHVAVARMWAGASFSPGLPPGFGGLVLTQLFVIALPEEVFFRGYLQDRLRRAFPAEPSFFGAAGGVAIVVQAAVFALCHLATGDWTRLRVFFFGLLAGWLRARSGSIAGPVAYHATANVWVAVLEASLRPPNL